METFFVNNSKLKVVICFLSVIHAASADLQLTPFNFGFAILRSKEVIDTYLLII